MKVKYVKEELPELKDFGLSIPDAEEGEEDYGEHGYESEPLLFWDDEGSLGIGTYHVICRPEKLQQIKKVFTGYDFRGCEVWGYEEDIMAWVPISELTKGGKR